VAGGRAVGSPQAARGTGGASARWTASHSDLDLSMKARTLLLAAMLAQVNATALVAQSLPKPLFTPADALLLGGFAVGTVLAAPLDRSFAERLQNRHVQENRLFGRAAAIVRNTAAPGAYLIGGTLYAVGRLAGNRDMADLGLHGTEALLIGSATGYLLKGTIGRARPYVHPRPDPNDYQLWRGFQGSGDYQSFPSGHTIAAFAAAATVTSETRRLASDYTWVVGPVLYGGAALTGLSRMYNNRHWASDVVVGAAIGTFAGLKVVRFHHSRPPTRTDRWLLNLSIAPASDGGRQVGLQMLPIR